MQKIDLVFLVSKDEGPIFSFVFLQNFIVQAKNQRSGIRLIKKHTEVAMLTLIFGLIFHVFHVILGVSTPSNKFPPPLSQEEEMKAFKLMHEGDEEARQRLILHNLRLVSHIIRKYYSASPDSEDLVSIGVIGLVKAVDTFRVESGTKFATYAARCIQNEVLMSFRAQKKRSGEISINETIDVDKDGNPLTYMDIISTNEDLSEDLDRKTQIERAIKMIKNRLDERERQIIVMRYGLLGLKRSYTQKEIAECLNISRSYVSRIEKSALDKLRNALGGQS